MILGYNLYASILFLKRMRYIQELIFACLSSCHRIDIDNIVKHATTSVEKTKSIIIIHITGSDDHPHCQKFRAHHRSSPSCWHSYLRCRYCVIIIAKESQGLLKSCESHEYSPNRKVLKKTRIATLAGATGATLADANLAGATSLLKSRRKVPVMTIMVKLPREIPSMILPGDFCLFASLLSPGRFV